MNDINEMPLVCGYCPYWEVCKPPYICPDIGDKEPKRTEKRTETPASDLISRQALCEYALNQKNKNITANDIMRFPSAQHESAKRTAEEARNVSDLDLISRKAAIDAFDGVKVDEENCTEYDIGYNDGIDFAVSRLSVLPSAQPERKKGKWIAVTEDGDVYKRICSCCGQEAFFQNDDPDELYDGGRYELSDFCPNCGADMRGEENG